MKNMKIVVALSVSLLFASCAPAVMGSQYSPYVATSALASAQATPGKTVYVQYDYSAGALAIPDAYFDNLIINFDTRVTNGDVASPETPANWLSMTPDGLPADWQISIDRALVRKEIVKTTLGSSDINVRYYDRLRVVYKIILPANAAGTELAHLSFKDRTNGKDIGTILLLIKASDASSPVGAQF